MASPILGASAAAAAAGTAATISPKGALSRLGLRTPSARDVITGKRIPGSASNHFLQRLGMETEEDRQKIINQAERKSSRKKGLGFVFKLLLKTLLDISELRRFYRNRNYFSRGKKLEEFMDELMALKKQEDKLIYILAYSSVLTDDGASQSMRNMLEQIRTTWGLKNAPRNGEVTDWKLLYHQYDRARRYRRSEATYFFDDNLDAKIDLLFEYINIVENKEKTRNRRMARMVARHSASKYNIDPTLLPYEKAGSNNAVGPLAHIGSFIPDTAEHKQKTIAAREWVGGQKFLKEYHRQRRQSAIQRDIALGRITEEEARKLPEDYGRALNTRERRSRKRKTRKRRKRKGTRKKKRRKSKRKSKRKYK